VRWALALAVVVLAVASWVALSKGSTPSGDDGVVHLDPNAADAGAADAGLKGVDLTGRAAPATTFTLFDGTTTSLEALRGTPVVLNFWASSCVPCVTEMPALEQAHQRYGEAVRFIGVDTAEGKAEGRSFVEAHPVTYPLAVDPLGADVKAFGGFGLPTTVLIDRDGTIVYNNTTAFHSADELEQLIQAKLAP
jgi:thiol-disulfide isomerase/thioredoxin